MTLPHTHGTKPGRDAALAVLLGILAALMGLAPWLVTGAQLPLQNLWATEAAPETMPLSLLPLSQYKLTVLVGLLTVGGAVAGLAVRVWAPVRRRLVTRCAAAGVLIVHFTAVVQSFAVVDAGLVPGTPSRIYVAGLLAGVIASVLAGLVALFLLASPSRTRLALGVGFMAAPFVGWGADWFYSIVGAAHAGPISSLLFRWLPAVLVGLALAWCGVRPWRRLWVWAMDLLLLWVVPALFISVNYVFGTRVMLGDAGEMLLMGRDILKATLGPDGGAGPLLLLALVIGLAGAGVQLLVRRRRALQPAP
ncbi:hypothetical protein V1639_08240 [Pseudarthrobacter sp. J75]|uniref:hypothetical protein n=1 Tax=unclassified Pseudarthrobacter TaxID=2647000 RepID=UPI002E809660|nr:MULTISPECIES: hypothetical protein [unclassified Pseudarthrobacter]MEE2522094.1 hypothetical protein [Pseudarthrobacter sp. J47]MEE2529019.1 hypothetical protein [Pseudarthrobacter sp. J75]MEE2570649.1 hypothetical protein [Pseudarthrobacter sp. J64]